MQGGSGLPLSIAGTSSSAVGLVLTAVLGFVVRNVLEHAQADGGRQTNGGRSEPAPQLPQEVAPPKEPEPEPVWFDAARGFEQGDVKAGIGAVAIEQVRIEDVTTFKKPKPQPMLKVKVVLENTSTDKIVKIVGWVGGMDLAGQGLGEVLGNTEAGKALAKVAGAHDKLRERSRRSPWSGPRSPIPDKKARAIGMWTGIAAVGLAIGPTLGGLLTEDSAGGASSSSTRVGARDRPGVPSRRRVTRPDGPGLRPARAAVVHRRDGRGNIRAHPGASHGWGSAGSSVASVGRRRARAFVLTELHSATR